MCLDEDRGEKSGACPHSVPASDNLVAPGHHTGSINLDEPPRISESGSVPGDHDGMANMCGKKIITALYKFCLVDVIT